MDTQSAVRELRFPRVAIGFENPLAGCRTSHLSMSYEPGPFLRVATPQYEAASIGFLEGRIENDGR
jgi:hypothetical protein